MVEGQPEDLLVDPLPLAIAYTTIDGRYMKFGVNRERVAVVIRNNTSDHNSTNICGNKMLFAVDMLQYMWSRTEKKLESQRLQKKYPDGSKGVRTNSTLRMFGICDSTETWSDVGT